MVSGWAREFYTVYPGFVSSVYVTAEPFVVCVVESVTVGFRCFGFQGFGWFGFRWFGFYVIRFFPIEWDSVESIWAGLFLALLVIVYVFFVEVIFSFSVDEVREVSAITCHFRRHFQVRSVPGLLGLQLCCCIRLVPRRL